jgi:hypothetical protein
MTNKIVIDAETWAESGGTAGIFGKYWRRGCLRIVSRDLTKTERERLEKVLS